MVDEFTRECLALEVARRVDTRQVREVLAPLMKGRGAPKFIRSDNGGEFVARLIAVFLSQSGSGSHYIEPGKPWQNGFVESFHFTLRREHLDVELFLNLADTQANKAVYRRYYSEVRPHASLGYRPPAEAALARAVVNSTRATPSLRCQPPVPESAESLIF